MLLLCSVACLECDLRRRQIGFCFIVKVDVPRVVSVFYQEHAALAAHAFDYDARAGLQHRHQSDARPTRCTTSSARARADGYNEVNIEARENLN